MLPENTKLGTLEYLEIYDFYDTPQFFSCKNERDEIYLALAVDSEPLTYLFVLIEDSSLLVLVNFGLNTPDFYLDLDYKVFKVTMSDTSDVVTELPQSEVKFYFLDYVQKRKESQEDFADFLKQIHGEES